jgi:predicted RNA-binding Zn-ribbon protein involved in translation (DUF1610 family)
MAKVPRHSDADLAAAVAQSFPVAQVMRILGIKPAGGSHFHLSKRIKRNGLDTSHFLGQAINRGKRQVRHSASQILILRDPQEPRAKPHMLRRALLEIGAPHMCSECGTGTIWMSRFLTLHVDHIDGNAWNCLRDNLRFLCPNCHSQTATYCRKASSRDSRSPSVD